MFPSRFVRGRDLPGPILAKITAIERETVHPRPGVTEDKWILRIERLTADGQPEKLQNVTHTKTGYGMVLRKALAEQIGEALASRNTDDWCDKRIVLFPIPAKAGGKDVISINARAPKNGHDKAAGT